MYQPGFRDLVQPQIDRVLALVGVAPQQKAAPAPQTPAQTPAKPMPGTAVAPPTTSPTDAAQLNTANPTGSSPDVAPVVPAKVPAATTPAPSSAPAAAKPEAPAGSKKLEPTTASSEGELPGDNSAVILSSKGAEKRLVHHVPPTLPKGAAAQALEGTVILKTVVDDTGKVESVRLVEGNPALAEAAIHAVKQWRYRPYVRDGKSLSFQTVVLVDFQRP